ncbi:MAG: acyl carrier protein [Ferruginibacter sp.]|nr:acyl carrier protein [Cytophagales bacterium]
MSYLENSAQPAVSFEKPFLPGTPSSVAAIEQWLATKFAEQLAIPAHAVSLEKSITSFGLDSMDAIIIAGDLEDWMGMELSSTLLWDFDTIAIIARHLFENLTAVRGQ